MKKRKWKAPLAVGLCVFGSVLLAGYCAVQVVDQRIASRCTEWLGAGVRELEAGSALTALTAIGDVLRQPGCAFSGDARVWADYAKARVRVREPELEHIIEAVRALQRARAINGSDPEISTLLAESMLGAGLADDAASTARRVLETHRYLPAQRIAAAALLASGQTQELRRRLDNDAWTDDGFWFRSTRILIADPASPDYETLVDHLLDAESDEAAHTVLRAVAGRIDLQQSADFFLRDMTAAGIEPALDVMGVALLLLQQFERPDLMLELLAHHKQSLDYALRTRLAELAWQAGRPELVAAAMEVGPVHLYEVPELISYGALAGHEPSVKAIREKSESETIVADAWRSLVLAVLDGEGPKAIADASAEALRDAPGSALALTLAAESWLQLGEVRRAEKLAVQAAQSAPFWAQPRLVLGAVRVLKASNGEGSGNKTYSLEDCVPNDEKIEAFLDCVSEGLHESASSWQILLAAIDKSLQTRDLKSADMLVDMLQAEMPETATVWRMMRAKVLLASGRNEQEAASAALRLREVLEISQGHADARLLLSLARARLGDKEGARAEVVAVIETEPDLWRDALSTAVLLHREEGDSRSLVQLAGDIFMRAPLSDQARLQVESNWLQGLVNLASRNGQTSLASAANMRLAEISPVPETLESDV